MTKRKVIIFAIVVSLFFAFIYAQCYNKTAAPEYIRVEKIEITENLITIFGFNYGGMFNYRGYDLRYSDGELRVRYRGGIEVPYMKGTNSPDFYPIPNIYGDELEEIYLCDIFGKSKRLIWSKEAGIVI